MVILKNINIIFWFCICFWTNNLFAQLKEDTLIKYTITEKPANYHGGFDEVFKIIKKNFIYPEVAKEFGFEGDFWIEVEIDSDGNCKLIGISTSSIRQHGKEVDLELEKHKSIERSMKSEIIRLVNLLKNWNPKTINNRTTSSQLKFPFHFYFK